MTAIVGSTFLRDLIFGFLDYLTAADIGLAAAGSTTAGQTPMYAMSVPQSPDRVVTLSPVLLSADATQAMSVMELQVRSRSAGEDVSDVWALDDSIASVLLGNFPLTLSTDVRVSTLVFQSGGSLGQDGNQRWMWSSNFLLNVYRPGPHRL